MTKKNFHSIIIMIICFSNLHFYGVPDNIEPVQNFDMNKYLGKWYEIARIENSAQKSMIQVQAEYSKISNKKFKFITKGFLEKEKKWKVIESKAYFAQSEKEGYLKVSILGPIYTSYIIFEIGKDYEYAFIAGYNKSYLWLLSRQKQLDQKIIDRFIKKSKDLDFKIDGLLFTKQ